MQIMDSDIRVGWVIQSLKPTRCFMPMIYMDALKHIKAQPTLHFHNNNM